MKERETEIKTPEAIPQQSGSAPEPAPSTRTSVDSVLQLQQTIGNQAVQRLIESMTDKGEADTSGDDSIAQRIDAAEGSGRRLDANIERQLEEGLSADLSNVRVHTDTNADQLARAVGAVAFTSGQDIFFRKGTYNPVSQEGMRLLAHEVTHTVQQAAGPVAGTPAPGGVFVSKPSDSFEQAAEQVAAGVVAGMPNTAHRMLPSIPPASIQRKAAPEEEEEAAKQKATLSCVVQRQGSPAPAKPAPAKPSIEQLVATLFENQVKLNMASAARTRIALCADTFTDAVNNVINKDAEAQKALAAETGLANVIIDLALDALVPGAAAVVLGPVKNKLKQFASVAIEGALKSKTIDDAARIEAYLKAEEKIDELAKKVDGPAVKKLITALAASKEETPSKGAAPPGVQTTSKAEAFLAGLKQTMKSKAQAISDNLGDRSIEEIAAVSVAYDVNVKTQGVYEGQIRELLSHYKELQGTAVEPSWTRGGNFLVYLDVWGGRRLAVLKVTPGHVAIFPTRKVTYEFVRYVAPEEEEMSKTAAGGAITVFDLAAYRPGGTFYNMAVFTGHIPQPDVETPFIAEVNAWGGPHLAHVAVVGGRPKFVSWVSALQEPWEREKGKGQPGGLRQYMDRDLQGPIPPPPVG